MLGGYFILPHPVYLEVEYLKMVHLSDKHKFDHCLSRLLHSDLHWLDVPERIQYKTGVTVHRCLQSKTPKYLTDCCTQVSEIVS